MPTRMTAWNPLRNLFYKARLLWALSLFALFLFLMAIPFFSAQVAAAPNPVLNFQGRILNATGSVVPDGYYNMQFKIYHGGSGTAVNNPGGTLDWTESYINNGGTSGVRVRNGIFSVQLGSITPFGSSVDWNEDVLWLSMNVAGSDAACTTFGQSPCPADGEMLRMNRITSVPNALNSNAVGGKTVNQLVQLAQGVQTDASNNTSSIFINKTGSGSLIQLQNTATDVFTVGNSGNIELGNNDDKSISITISDEDQSGRKLSIVAGGGGNGTGAAGGDLILQGGDAGGANGNAGNVKIDTGAAAGSGSSGLIAIGELNAGEITVGSTSAAVEQNISIGANNTAGSSTDVTVGSGENADSGSTTIRAKNSVTIETNGTDRAVFSDTTNTVYFGNGVSSSTPDDYTLQGTNSSATAVAGGSLTLQGGDALTGDANGGNLVLAGGSGSGNGSTGLVVLKTPAFSTITNDTGCFIGGSNVADSCTVSSASVNNSSAVIVGFSAPGRTATLPDPSNVTPGRIIYVMASGNTQPFTLLINDGAGSNQIAMRSNITATLLWNGSDWSLASGSNTATLQSGYESTPQNASGTTELVLNSTSATRGLAIRDSGINPNNDSLISVINSESANIFSVNTKLADGTEYASDGTVSDAGNFATNWSAVGTASVSRLTTDGQAGDDSAQAVAGQTANNGVRHKLSINPLVETGYRVSFYAKLTAGSNFNDIKVRYTPDGGTSFVDCTDYNTQAVPTAAWTQIFCTITTTATEATDPYVYFVQPTSAADARTYLIDTVSFIITPKNTQNVKIGNNGGGDDTTLFTVDKSATAPTGSHDALLGSMYYDTVKGKLQCYESDGWGPCGASPDSFITLSPEYSGAVVHGEGVGTISSEFCSDTLDINDGSSGQPTVCGTNETYNFYQWTSPEVTTQTRSIFVTYKLPENFKEFVPSATSLMGRTNSSDSNVSFAVYRNHDDGLSACGSPTSVANGNMSSWNKSSLSGNSDPSNCDFSAGDSMVIRIDMNADNNAQAYASNLSFAFSIL